MNANDAYLPLTAPAAAALADNQFVDSMVVNFQPAGQESTAYSTFPNHPNYKWNRHNSADSRFWGFVPEDHIVGKALFVWFSYDKELDWSDGRLRVDRFFNGIE